MTKFLNIKGNLADAKKRARKSDLVIPPAGHTNCGNCEYITTDNFCRHSKVRLYVKRSWCCIYWDAPGTIRVYKKLRKVG